MHCGRRLLTSGIRLLCGRQQRLLSVSNHVVKSSLPDVEIPDIAVPDYVWQNIDQWPDKVAVECGVTGRRYRYAEMRKLCRRFAASLRRAGLQPGDTLTIVMPNTAEWPIVLLGAMEAGLVVSTANPHYTAGEITRQLRDSQPKAIVIFSAILPTVQEAIKLSGTQSKPLIVIAPGLETASDIPVGTVDLRQMLQDGVDTSGVRFAGPIDDIVALPYSSGTTGLPKGVILSHRNIVSNVAQLNGRHEIRHTEPALGYGMTETSALISAMVKGSSKYESVGGPMPNTEIKVVDLETGSSLAARQTGEICMRGPQVMKGYFNRPGDTAEIIDSEGWLHTGDLGYYDEEGHFYVVDRLKELIKVKGFQVAPAELEEILRSHPDIDDAAVVGVPDDRAGEVPRAFVVPARPGVSEEDVKQFVAAKLSEHKQLKGGVKFLTSIPKSPSGKILRRELKGVL